MLFAITAMDRNDTDGARSEHHEAHVAHFKANKDRIALAGPLLHENGTSAGSLVLFDAASEAEARDFIEADPFFPAGVWERIDIVRFKPSIHAPGMLS